MKNVGLTIRKIIFMHGFPTNQLVKTLSRVCIRSFLARDIGGGVCKKTG
jgi:hypothetical protein